MRVLILDDETKRANVWKKSLDALVSGEVVVYETGQVSELIGELHRAGLIREKVSISRLRAWKVTI